MKYASCYICFLCIVCGIIFYALHNEWIIIRMPQFHSSHNHGSTIKKQISLFFWKDKRWQKETQEILWNNNLQDAIFYVVSYWLNNLSDEKLLNKTVVVQSAILSSDGKELYISFDRNPLHKDWSIYEKWMLIESLLKTLKDNDIPIKNIYFLVQHEPLHDTHLDFNNPWPIDGFLAAQQSLQ